MRVTVVAILLTLSLLAGCLGGQGDENPAATIAPKAEEAGAKSGPAPSAPDQPFQVEAAAATGTGSETVTAFPVALETNDAKAPVTKTYEGAFDPAACNPNGGGLPLGGLGLAQSFHFYDLAENLAVNDVFSYVVEMTYENSDSAWAELHLFYGFGADNGYWTDPTADKRGVVRMNFTGQGFHAKDDQAWVGAACWYGQTTSPIPYTITVTLTFAEGAIPSGAPIYVEVPANATRLFVRGVALDPTEGVMSHFRVFGPDDKLVCECALGSKMEVSTLTLQGPGGYVLLVDHTANGFVSLALDAPSPKDLVVMDTKWEMYPIASSDGSAVTEDVKLEFKSVPLNVGSWVNPPGDWETPTPDAGFGNNLNLTLRNARGEVLHMAMGSYVTYRAMVPGFFGTMEWMPTPLPGEWSFGVDHHAFAEGTQTAHVEAETLRGTVMVFASHYVRPGTAGA